MKIVIYLSLLTLAMFVFFRSFIYADWSNWLFPRTISIVMIFSMFFILINEIKELLENEKKSKPFKESFRKIIKNNKKMIIAILLAFLYVILAKYNFYIVSFIFMIIAIASTYEGSEKKLRKCVITPSIFITFLYIALEYMFKLRIK